MYFSFFYFSMFIKFCKGKFDCFSHYPFLPLNERNIKGKTNRNYRGTENSAYTLVIIGKKFKSLPLSPFAHMHKQLKGKVEVLELKRYFLFIVLSLITLLSKINLKIV